ncbi:MAG: DUF5694 domain-containing protein [Flavobacteriaceae bacterium]|nr:DUF5694 domain-containing protein [Flavobacteriaceae bacterium]
MKYIFLVIFNLISFNYAFSQDKIEDFLLWDHRQTKVLLLGTFHFENPNLDTHKNENSIDILNDLRQAQVLEIVDKINKFKPTIICLERTDNASLNEKYNAYIKSKYTLTANEVDQLGFRIAKINDLKKVFAVDATSYLRDNLKKDSVLSHIWDEEFYLDTDEASHWSEKYYNWYKYLDNKSLDLSLSEYLKIINQPKNLKYNLGEYLVDSKTSNHNGPDFIALDWYDRNLRIFNNILKTNPTSEDRILIIFGSGHIPILQHLFESSPQFEVVNILEYL